MLKISHGTGGTSCCESDSNQISRILPMLALLIGAFGIAGAPIISKMVMNWEKNLAPLGGINHLSPVAVAFLAHGDSNTSVSRLYFF